MRYLSYLFSVLLLIFSSLHTLCAQTTFSDVISKRKNAVLSVGAALRIQMAPLAWCEVGRTCVTDSDTCALHGCSGGTFGDDFVCTTNITVAEQPKICKDSENPKGILLNFKRAFIWTPQGTIANTGDGKPITVKNDALRRDVCALRNMESDLINAYNENKAWLYAGTSNGAFAIFPGSALPRDDNAFDGCGFDPIVRPWYIAAASGPKDIVFLLDATSSDLQGTTLIKTLKIIIEGVSDIRDFVSVVAVGGPESTLGPIGGTETLKRADKENKERITDALDNLTPSEGNPNYGAAFKTAFTILSNAKVPDSSSGCNKLIVLLSFKEDECFLKCIGGRECNCVQKLRGIISENQENFDEPVSIVSFSEGSSKNNERAARTIVCDRGASGIWRGVTEGDTDRSVLSTYSSIASASVFDENPNVFASEIYEDIAGLGDVFTLALPVYSNDEKRLVGVAGADITVKEVEKLLGDASQARTEIDKLSLESRNCNRVDRKRDSCDFQVLRNQPNSAICADIFPKKPRISTGQSSYCYKLGKSFYKMSNPGQLASWDDAVGQCSSLNESKLARVDGPGKNTFLSSIVDADGSWIGLRAEISSALLWQDDPTVLEYNEFSFAVAEELEDVHGRENFAACATMDRRGISGNWNVEVCTALRSFVCELSPTATIELCKGNIFEPRGIGSTYKPTHNVDCPQLSGPTTNCTDEEEEGIKNADPFCKESKIEFSTSDRKCCGGKADGLFVETGPSPDPTGLGVGGIVGIVIGVVFCLLVVILVMIGYRKYHKKGYRADGAAPKDDEMPAQGGIGGIGDAANRGATGAGAATLTTGGTRSNEEGKEQSAPILTAFRVSSAAEEDPFASPFKAGTVGDGDRDFGEQKSLADGRGNSLLDNYGY